MRPHLFTAAALLTTGLASGPALASITYLTQTRTVSSSLSGGSQSFSAPDFNPFTQTASVTSGTATLSASQNSSLGPAGIVSSGQCTYLRTGMTTASGSATSSLDATFSLDAPATFTFIAFGFPVTFSGPGISLGGFGSYNQTGIAQPGTYHVSATVTINAPEPTSSGLNWNLNLQFAACRSDFDHSGGVSVQDIFAFLAAWFAQNGLTGPGHTADFNNDNFVNVTDIFAFLAVWFTGC